MAGILTTASDVTSAIQTTDGVILGLDLVFLKCASLTPATQAQWGAFKTSWVAFVDSVNSQIFRVPITGQGYATFDPIAAMTAVEGFQTQVAGWQGIAAKSCGAAGPLVTPPPTGDPAWLTAIKYGAVALGGIVVLVLVAPLVETVIASKAAGVAAGRVKASVASTRRLARRARGTA
jgi:hypothetical protein